MINAADRPRTSTTQLGLVVLAILVLTFSFFRLAEPVRASHVDGATVQLHQDLGDGVSGENPGEFAGNEDECAGVEEGTTVFHFVANGLADGTVATESELHATFEGMGEVVVNGYYPNGEWQPTVHFEIVIEGDATLTDAYAVFNVDQTEDAKLVLSHICGGGEGQVSEDLTLIKQDAEGGPLATVGFTLGDGEEMLTDESGQIVFTGLGEGAWTLTETTAPTGCEAGGTLTVTIDGEGTVSVTDDDETDSLAIVSFDAETNVLTLSNDCGNEGGQGMLEVEKFWCPTEGETRTEIDIFGPALPQARTMTEGEGEMDGCTVGADVAFTVYASDGETVVTTFTTDENGIAEIWLDPGDYVLCEDVSGACADFTIADGAVTAAVVVNYVAEEAPQGQVKVLKYVCDAETDSVEFYLEGQAPNLENCDPADAEFTLDGGAAFSTTDGIAIVWADEGSHTLAEVGTDASVDIDVVEGEITTVIVLNNVERDTQGGGETPNNGGNGNGVEGGVQGGQGGPGAGLPDTATGDTTGFPFGVLALLMLAGLGGFGALNLQSVRRRIG